MIFYWMQMIYTRFVLFTALGKYSRCQADVLQALLHLLLSSCIYIFFLTFLFLKTELFFFSLFECSVLYVEHVVATENRQRTPGIN